MKAKENEDVPGLYCDICQISCPGPDNMKMHLVSKKHQVRHCLKDRPKVKHLSALKPNICRRIVGETGWQEIWVCLAVRSVVLAAVTNVLLTPTCKFSNDSFDWL